MYSMWTPCPDGVLWWRQHVEAALFRSLHFRSLRHYNNVVITVLVMAEATKIRPICWTHSAHFDFSLRVWKMSEGNKCHLTLLMDKGDTSVRTDKITLGKRFWSRTCWDISTEPHHQELNPWSEPLEVKQLLTVKSFGTRLGFIFRRLRRMRTVATGKETGRMEPTETRISFSPLSGYFLLKLYLQCHVHSWVFYHYFLAYSRADLRPAGVLRLAVNWQLLKLNITTQSHVLWRHLRLRPLLFSTSCPVMCVQRVRSPPSLIYRSIFLLNTFTVSF